MIDSNASDLLTSPASQVPLEEILADELLLKREARKPDYKTENEGLSSLSEALASSREDILQKLAVIAMQLTGSDSAGISVLETGDDGVENFRWRAIAGQLSPFLNGSMPRDFSPCGYVLKTMAPHLMLNPIRHYQYVSQLGLPLHEVLFVPFSIHGKLIGTVWAVAHTPIKKFDSEDLRLLTSLTRFASAAHQAKQSTFKEQETNQALKDREHRLQTMFETSPSFMAVLRGPDHVFEQVNENYLQLVGYRDVVGKTVFEALPEVRDQGFIELLDGVLSSGQPYIGKELTVALQRTPGGPLEQRYVDFVYQPDNLVGEKAQRIFVHGVDVTEKVKARHAVENERKNFQQLFAETPQFVAILAGPDHRFEFVNEAHVKMLGFDATGKTVREAQPESVQVYEWLEQVYHQGITMRFSEVPINLGDRLRFFDVTYAPRTDLNGKIDGIMVLGIEATSRVETRKSIEESRNQAVQLVSDLEAKTAQLQTILDTIPMSVMFAEAPSGKLLFANQQFEKVWKQPFISADEVEGYREYVGFRADGSRYQPHDWPLARTLKSNELVSEHIFIQLGDDSRAVLNVTAAPVKNPKGDVFGAIVLAEDVTDRRNAEANLKQARDEAIRANELKSAFLANMSHEIRTPLGAMLGFADLLKDPGLTTNERSSFADILVRNGEQLSYIINDILDLSKVEAGHLTLEYKQIHPDQVAAEVVSLLGVKAKEKDLVLEYSSDPSAPQNIVTDSVRLRQILLNIVGNAVKFTQFGSVSLRSYGGETKSGKRALCFEVKDTGIGISPNRADRLFEMFVQADGSITRKFGGTGLGLALSRRLARELGGDVTITETQEGKGTTFLITVEDRPELELHLDERSSPKEQADLPANVLDGIKVLVVDDAPDNQQLIWRYLTKRGAAVDSAENGLVGYRKALSGTYDVVLMDLQMPEMDGYTATQKLRSAGYQKPIIALTAHAMTEVRKKCLNVGCTDHLPKPINSKELVSSIATLARRN